MDIQTRKKLKDIDMMLNEALNDFVSGNNRKDSNSIANYVIDYISRNKLKILAIGNYYEVEEKIDGFLDDKTCFKSKKCKKQCKMCKNIDRLHGGLC